MCALKSSKIHFYVGFIMDSPTWTYKHRLLNPPRKMIAAPSKVAPSTRSYAEEDPGYWDGTNNHKVKPAM